MMAGKPADCSGMPLAARTIEWKLLPRGWATVAGPDIMGAPYSVRIFGQTGDGNFHMAFALEPNPGKMADERSFYDVANSGRAHRL